MLQVDKLRRSQPGLESPKKRQKPVVERRSVTSPAPYFIFHLNMKFGTEYYLWLTTNEIEMQGSFFIFFIFMRTQGETLKSTTLILISNSSSMLFPVPAHW